MTRAFSSAQAGRKNPTSKATTRRMDTGRIREDSTPAVKRRRKSAQRVEKLVHIIRRYIPILHTRPRLADARAQQHRRRRNLTFATCDYTLAIITIREEARIAPSDWHPTRSTPSSVTHRAQTPNLPHIHPPQASSRAKCATLSSRAMVLSHSTISTSRTGCKTAPTRIHHPSSRHAQSSPPAMHRRRFLCLLLALQLWRAQQAETTEVGKCNNFTVPEIQQETTFGLSKTAPIATALRENPRYIANLRRITDYLRRLETEIRARDPTTRREDERGFLEVCNAPNQRWSGGVENYILLRGFSAPDTSCITDFVGTRVRADQPPLVDERRLRDMLLRPALELRPVVSRIVRQTVANWSRPAVTSTFRFARGSAVCTLEAQGGIRVGRDWFVDVRFQSIPQGYSSPKFGRQVIAELHGVRDGRLITQSMCIPARPRTGTLRMYDNFTTILGSFRQIGHPSTHGAVEIAANPAVLAALDDADIFLGQADDATTSSNIAILMLPLALNLLPISLVTDAKTGVILLYALLSDVVTVVPLAIKGVELIVIARQRVRRTVTRISSAADRSVSDTAGVDMWFAECRARDGIQSIGVLFVVLALVFMAGGVYAEYAARRFALKRRARWREVLSSRDSGERGGWFEKVFTEESLGFAGQGLDGGVILGDARNEKRR